MRKTYTVYIQRYSSTARNAGIVGSQPEAVRYGQTLEPPIIVTGYGSSSRVFDEWAFGKVCAAYQARHPEETRPLAGKSYIRQCRTEG